MASSAAGTSLGSEYQVFLSFRGPDTREGFTDVLFHNLTDAGICIFRDDEELRVGERIDGLLQQAIDNSKIYIPVFSRTYAASQWCLRELAQIVENTSRSEGNKEILPIFVDVEPDDVKLKTPLYHNAILTLKLNKKLSNEQVDACRMALKEVGAIKGREVKNHWCLCELAHIVANTSKSEGNKEILPIFFDVEPDDVKLKTRMYRDAINKLKRKKNFSSELVDGWREALMEVDEIKGWEMKKYGSFDKLIKLVVEKVMEKLQTIHRRVTDHLVGIDGQVRAVSKLLDVNSNDVRLIMIHGMRGIGKTTLSRVVFNQLSSHFGKSCFLECVRAKSSSYDGLIELQKKLLAAIGNPLGKRKNDDKSYEIKRTGETLHNKKVLIVLDDVDDGEQVKKLIGNNTLYSGSRIMITTRNRDVLRIDAPKYQILDYEMEVMSTDGALKLFIGHAFKGDSASDDYSYLSREIVSVIGSNPLALEVIGALLYRKTQEQWIETLKKLRKTPHKDAFGMLKISYDALTFEQQQIFLDIACFFVGEEKTNAIYMWKDCKFFPDSGVAVLISMSLMKIVGNKFWMHDQLRDLGREIVRQENTINPAKRSRIWNYKEVLDAIRVEEMNKNVRALYLDTYQLSSQDEVFRSNEIGRFEHLRFLTLTGGTFVGDLANCLTELRWISWNHTRQIYEWTNMYLKNVVILEFSDIGSLDDSRLQNLIKARKLKVISLKSCHSIKQTPDFSECPNIERLTFVDCSNLRKIDGSIGKLRCLIYLKIDRCFHLEDLPEEIGDLENLKHFFVTCNVKKLPDSVCQLKSLSEVHFSSGCDN
ncbi:disease resistance protein Roq1-like [Syzygium oleosum]|uniref:disease resistance protein Roq1-like n=1 Tax=Syzygium oleosum TaxID=219896 RepID=UPI0024B8805B|nr:disease resistance protein Roq1-like [Syzygium oleosum]